MVAFIGHLMRHPDEDMRDEITSITIKNAGDYTRRELIVKFGCPQNDDEICAMLVHASDVIGEDFMGALQAEVGFMSVVERDKPGMKNYKPTNVSELNFNVKVTADGVNGIPPADGGQNTEAVDDGLFARALELLRETRRASLTMFQRRLDISEERAVELMNALEEQGIVGPPREDGETREILEDLGEGEEAEESDEDDEGDEAEDGEEVEDE
jgi:DNA segregation ATPase FtsK/SpoIIIE-like protein